MMTTGQAAVIKNGGQGHIEQRINRMEKSVFVLVHRNTVANRQCVTAGEVYEMPELEAYKLVHAGKGTIVTPDQATKDAIDQHFEEITSMQDVEQNSGESIEVVEDKTMPNIDEQKPAKKAGRPSKKR